MLDVGCGTGDVSALVAECVGATGEVVGVDRAAADPAAALRRAASLVRPGGIVAFAETVVFEPLPWPPRPLFARATGWIRDALEGTGDPGAAALLLPY